MWSRVLQPVSERRSEVITHLSHLQEETDPPPVPPSLHLTSLWHHHYTPTPVPPPLCLWYHHTPGPWLYRPLYIWHRSDIIITHLRYCWVLYFFGDIISDVIRCFCCWVFFSQRQDCVLIKERLHVIIDLMIDDILLIYWIYLIFCLFVY